MIFNKYIEVFEATNFHFSMEEKDVIEHTDVNCRVLTI